MTINNTEVNASIVLALISCAGLVLTAIFPNLLNGLFGRKKITAEVEATMQDRALNALRATIETLQEENTRQAEVLTSLDERNIARMNALAREQDRLAQENRALQYGLSIVLVHVHALETIIRDMGEVPPPRPVYEKGE